MNDLRLNPICHAARPNKPPAFNRIRAGAQYHKVLDGRKRAIRGLGQRGSHFHARLAI
jgi:hypothetical protein